MHPDKNQYQNLISEIGSLLLQGRQKAAYAVNTILVNTYWEIGRHIVEFEQDGNEKAEYGSRLLDRLSSDLTQVYGKGYGRSNLFYMRKLYLSFPISGTLSHKLTWSHYYEILKADLVLEISFYAKQSEKENWSVRELKRQMKSMLFHRLALSKDKDAVLKMANEGHEVQKPEDLIKEPFVLEFLNIPQQHTYLESELEQKLIDHLQKFLLELGKGFAFIARQYRISLAGKHFLCRPSFLSSYTQMFRFNKLKKR